MSDPVRHHTARVAILTRHGQTADADAARRDLAAARIERVIVAELKSEHPPTPEQQAFLAALLTGGAR